MQYRTYETDIDLHENKPLEGKYTIEPSLTATSLTPPLFSCTGEQFLHLRVF